MCVQFCVRPVWKLARFTDAARNSALAKHMAARGMQVRMTGDIRPTEIAAASALSRTGDRMLFPMIWGFTVPGRKAPVINCRIETAAEHPLWRESWRLRRCLIPASWYYEWEHIQQPDGKLKPGRKFGICPVEESVTCIAGLYRMEERCGMQVPVFSIITREPSAELRRLHDRMPLILPEKAVAEWVSHDCDPHETAEKALTHLETELADRERLFPDRLWNLPIY